MTTARAEDSTRPAGQCWVRRGWRPSPQQLAQAPQWLAMGKPIPAYWLHYLGLRRGAA